MLFFAYGSLVNPDVLAELCPGAIPVGKARITDHALCFTGHSERWGGSTATIGLAPNCDLWGALYEIDDDGRAAIERSGAPDGYVWSSTSVRNGDGAPVSAGVLCKVKDFERHSPSEDYLNVLKAGWEHWGLDGARMLQEVPPTV
jgi:hypothetical protein